jgi:hypothetical protein
LHQTTGICGLDIYVEISKDLAADVLEGRVDRGRAAVANQLYNTLIRAVEQERKLRELEEIAARLEALEDVLKTRRTG